MKKYIKVDLSEKQLEDIIRREPDLIEKGLQYRARARKTARVSAIHFTA